MLRRFTDSEGAESERRYWPCMNVGQSIIERIM